MYTVHLMIGYTSLKWHLSKESICKQNLFINDFTRFKNIYISLHLGVEHCNEKKKCFFFRIIYICMMGYSKITKIINFYHNFGRKNVRHFKFVPSNYNRHLKQLFQILFEPMKYTFCGNIFYFEILIFPDINSITN